MNQLSKISNSKPASFDSNSITTQGQFALVNFLKTKVEKGEIITRDDIVDFYIANVKGSEYYKVYGLKPHSNPEYRHSVIDYDNYSVKKWRDKYNIKTTALMWFRNNLGSCILKGKLLAIPVIEI
jgi:hypothetical protein